MKASTFMVLHFSYAELDHLAEEFIDAETNIEIEAEVEIVFPYNVYFEGVYLSYRFGPNENCPNFNGTRWRLIHSFT